MLVLQQSSPLLQQKLNQGAVLQQPCNHFSGLGFVPSRRSIYWWTRSWTRQTQLQDMEELMYFALMMLKRISPSNPAYPLVLTGHSQPANQGVAMETP